MGRPAGHDEQRKPDHKIRPVARYHPPRPPRKREQRGADAYITDEGDGVGHHHRPHELWVRLPANGMRHQRDHPNHAFSLAKPTPLRPDGYAKHLALTPRSYAMQL